MRYTIMPVSFHSNKLRRRHKQRFDMLKEWYGEDFACNEIAAHMPQPIQLGDAVCGELEKLNSPEMLHFITLSGNWEKICGAALAKMTTPLRLQDGILELEVRHTALILELKPTMKMLQKRLDQWFGTAICTDIKLVISGGGRSRR